MAYLSTTIAFGFDEFNALALMDAYQLLGCRSCQFYRHRAKRYDLLQIKRTLEDHGLFFDSIHGYFGDDLDPSSPDESIRKKTIEVYRQEADVALRLGSGLVVVHPSPPIIENKLPTQWQIGQRDEALWRSMQELAEIGQAMGVVYLMENLPSHFYIGNDPVGLAQKIRDLNSDAIRMCFDIGHAHITGNVVQAIDDCCDVIAYVHIHDNNALLDDHQVPTQGTVPWTQVTAPMTRIPKEVPAMLEVFRCHDEITQWAKRGLGDQLAQWLSLT